MALAMDLLQKSPIAKLVGGSEDKPEAKPGKILVGYTEEPRVDILHLMHRKCMNPECGASGEAGRFFLRNCGHVFCLSCIFDYLEFEINKKNKARIGCPHEKCKRRIHENDIRALLDPENLGLDDYLPSFDRRVWQHEHDKHVIEYSSRDQVKPCPRCLNYYSKKAGCNYTRCPNLYCNTWFCYSCAKPISSWEHFTKNTDCLVSADDLYTMVYIPRLLLFTDSVGLFCMLPAVVILAYFLIPMFVFFGFPYYGLREFRELATHNGRRKVNPYLLIVIQAILAPILFMLSIPMTVSAALFGIPLVLVYIALAVVKCIPPVSKVMDAIDCIFSITSFMGLGDWKKIVQDSRDARKQLEIEEMHKKEEKSEEISTESLNDLEKGMKQAQKDVSKERKERATGLKAMKNLNIPAVMIFNKFKGKNKK